MKEQTRQEPKIAAAAERQMQAYSLTQQMAEDAARKHRVDRPHRQLGEYITLSREAGAGGSEIALLAGQKLGWEVLDKSLVDQVAERFHLNRSMLELVDETETNWAHDLLGPWIDPRIIPHGKYVCRLVRVVAAAVRRGNVLLVGRGAQFLLPRDQGMAVRIIASEKYRTAHWMEQHGLSEAQARQQMAELDRGRREFVLRHFHHDINDPHLFDLVIHVDRIGAEGAAELIVATYRRLYAPRPQ